MKALQPILAGVLTGVALVTLFLGCAILMLGIVVAVAL